MGHRSKNFHDENPFGQDQLGSKKDSKYFIKHLPENNFRIVHVVHSEKSQHISSAFNVCCLRTFSWHS
ncbi:unnamed protein product [Hermetia illucens]|uniref:Uncharacterized protein n=1 Tax=Hermetia illucens TaxID=343691 RepID=A0A7R8Z0Q5_HERIL|nr:unnamed protein product [Hermetia illucens]